MKTKVCSNCKKEKPVSDFYTSKRDGYRSRCKVCEREYRREAIKDGYYKRYFKTRGREYQNQYWKEYRKLPDSRAKILVRQYTHTAIRSGKLKKEPCAVCGQEQVQIHHPDYNEPLLIVWLCPECHRKLHEIILNKEG